MAAGDAIDLTGNSFADHNGMSVTVFTEDGDAASFDDVTGTTQIALPDGTVEISIGAPPKLKKDTAFDDNLAEQLSNPS